MPENSSELEKISARTLADYDRQAEQFWAGTRDHDVSQNIARAAAAHRGHAAVHDARFRLRARARPQDAYRRWATSRSGWKARRNLWPWRARTAAARSGSRISSPSICRPAASTACSPTPRCFTCRASELPDVLRQAARGAEAGRRAVQLEPARPQRGRLERRALRRLPRSRKLAPLRRRRGFRRARPLLPPAGLPREQQPWLASVWRKPAGCVGSLAPFIACTGIRSRLSATLQCRARPWSRLRL